MFFPPSYRVLFVRLDGDPVVDASDVVRLRRAPSRRSVSTVDSKSCTQTLNLFGGDMVAVVTCCPDFTISPPATCKHWISCAVKKIVERNGSDTDSTYVRSCCARPCRVFAWQSAHLG